MTQPRQQGFHHHHTNNLVTEEVDTSKVLAPDGAGGVEFRAEGGADAFEVSEVDDSPSIANPTLIQVPQGSLSQPSAGVAVIDMRPVISLYDATGATDGAETNFPLPDFVVPDSVMVWEDGLMLRPVVDYVEDADMSGVTLTSAPPAATALLIRYEAEQT